MPRFSKVAPLSLLVAALSASPSFARQLVTLPGGTPIKIRSVEAVSSETAHKGELLEIRAVDPIVLDGWIVVSENARGQAEVIDAEPAGKHGHPGKLVLKYDIAVGTRISTRPPHRSERAQFTHSAPTLGV